MMYLKSILNEKDTNPPNDCLLALLMAPIVLFSEFCGKFLKAATVVDNGTLHNRRWRPAWGIRTIYNFFCRFDIFESCLKSIKILGYIWVSRTLENPCLLKLKELNNSLAHSIV